MPETVDDVRSVVLRAVSRQKPGSPGDLPASSDEIDALLGEISSFRPEWTSAPSVYRLALLQTGQGIVPFEETLLLPDTKHTYALELEMLSHIRTQKGLPPVVMPLFLYPDEIEQALRPREQVRPSDVLAGLPEKNLAPLSARRVRRVLRRQDWSETRHAVLDRDDWECRRCAAPKDLHLYRVDESCDQFDPAGYVALCRACLPDEKRRVVHRGHELVADDVRGIRSQLVVMFQRGSVERLGFVLGKEYAVIDA